MYRSILVPLDGSSFSEQALPLAIKIAHQSGATLNLVHVTGQYTFDPIYIDGVPVIDANLHSRARDHARTYLEHVRERIIAETPMSVHATLIDIATPDASNGTIAQVLAEHTASAAIDLVIMTTHGRAGLTRFWIGSVADGMVRHSCVPLLLLRPESQSQVIVPPTIRHILLPLDGSARSEAIVEHALALGHAMHARYTLLRLVMPLIVGTTIPFTASADFDPARTQQLQAEAQHDLDRIAQQIQLAGAHADTRVCVSTQIAATILEVAEESHADLLALSTHGRSGMARLLIGSVADKVLRGTHLPVLLFRPAISEPA
ncbi:MAG TPA: universal stress protein [Roseiflexaceae bacterium]|nr:universal stress protein [Roseiflexaceae bacterium]HMP41142.1 universal stress protein [Roseiflexaceae bacterium]